MCQQEKSETPEPPERWSAVEQVTAACAVAAALETGLAGALTAEPRLAAELASSLALDPERTGYVLDVLVAQGLARRHDGAYVRGPVLETMLDMGRAGAHALRLMGRLGSALRGEPVGWTMDADPDERAAVYREAASGLAQMFSAASAELAGALPPCRRILDLGCGSGVWGLSLARRNPEADVVGVDFARVLPAMWECATTLGLEDRVELLAADVLRDDLPGEFDTVLLANLLRLEPPTVAREMIRRASACLSPGGRLVIVDAIAEGSERARQAVALYALHLGLRTSRGQVHAREKIATWMGEAGLQEITALALEAGPRHLGVLVGTFPRDGDTR